MGIFDDVRKANIMIEGCNKNISDYESEYENLIRKIQTCRGDIDKIKDYLGKWQHYLNQRTNFIKIACKFDCDEIGEVLAKLISKVECQNYVYYVADYKVEELVSSRAGSEIDYDEYDVYMINKLSKSSKKYETSEGTFFSSDDDIIILKINNKLGKREKSISFYDEELKRMIDAKKFDYVYDFINYIIDSKVEMKKTILSKEELEVLLDSFLVSYDIKSCKKINM